MNYIILLIEYNIISFLFFLSQNKDKIDVFIIELVFLSFFEEMMRE